MTELMQWIRTTHFPDKPWLMLGKGPTFSRRNEFDLSQFNLISLNHAVRELKVNVAHAIDLDVIHSCADQLMENCDWVLIPRRPHINNGPSPVPLEELMKTDRVLKMLDEAGKLVWYHLSSDRTTPGQSPVINVRYFSSVAVFNILAQMGVKVIRSLGIDGGRAYSQSFNDLKGTTLLANKKPYFDLQFSKIADIVNENDMDYKPMIEPMRVFVGTDQSQLIPSKVLEYTIRKYATGPVEFVPMQELRVPTPKNKANRPRTGFSFYRFLIPKLCNYQGRALYVDADMQVFGDLAELWNIPFGQHTVLCTNQPEPPESWKKRTTTFKSGRQMSVMLLDCSRLRWDIDQIVEGLDEGRYTYQQLMFDLCVVPPDEIADDIPPEWNCLEHYEAAKTKLLHYTVVATQPWKNDTNPLRGTWIEAFKETIQAGAIDLEDVQSCIQAGLAMPSLAEYFPAAPGGKRALRRGGVLNFLRNTIGALRK